MRKFVICSILILTVSLAFGINSDKTDFCENQAAVDMSNNARRLSYTIEWSLIINHIAAVGLTPVFDTLLWVSSGGRTSSGDPNWMLIYNLNTRTLVDSFLQATTATWGYRDMCFYQGFVYAGTEATLHKISPVPPYTVVGTYSVSGISGSVIRALTDNDVEDSLWTSNWAVPIYKFWNQGGAVRTVASNTYSIYGLGYDPRGFCWGSAQNPMSTLVKYNYPDFAVIDTATLVEITNPLGDSAIAGGCEVWRDSFVLYLGQAKPLDKVYCIKPVPPLANDVGVDEILSPGAYHTPGTLMTPSARIQNYGTATQTNFQTVCSIVGAGLSYTSTKIVASLAGGTTTTVNFDTLRPTITGICTVRIRTNLLNDANPANDRKTKTCNISNITIVIIGTGTAADGYPLYRLYNYSTHEAIYLQSEINTFGNITNLAYYRSSGTNVAPVENVEIYMAHTTETSLASGSVTIPPPPPYQLVYSGTFPNDAGEGWREVTLSSPFNYNNSDNLKILIVKGYQAWVSGGPQWRYTSTSPTYRTRRAGLDANQPTSLTASYNLPNIMLTMTTQPPPANDVGVLEIRAPGAMHPINTSMTPIAVVKNYGTATQTNFSVICSIVGPTQVRYTNTKTIPSLASGDTIRVNFDAWIPTYAEYESVYMRTTLATDEVPTNDRKSRATEVYSAILLERFDDVTFPPTGWTRYNFGGGDSWVRQISYFYSAPACAYIYYDLPNNDWLITPRIRRTGPSDSLIFWYRNHTTSTIYYESLLVRVSNNANVADTSRYTVIGTIENYNNITWWRAAYHLTPYGESLYIAFHYKNYDDWGMAVDDIRVSGVVGILEEKPNKLPTITMLNAPKPNPVTDGLAKISFTIAEPTRASLKIYDASGRIIKTLVNELMSPGVYNLVWNGTDDNSNKVAEGIYFYTLTTDNQNITKKLVYTR